jgi:ribosomal protein S27E
MSEELVDEEVTCRTCGATFVHPVGEQKWMREKWGDSYQKPVRCRDCRRKRREANRDKQIFD